MSLTLANASVNDLGKRILGSIYANRRSRKLALSIRLFQGF